VGGFFAVPGDAAEGITRLRVIMRWNAQPEGPCSDGFDFGEVEDYCINIFAGTPPDCIPPDSVRLEPQGFSTLSAMWPSVPNAWSYEIRYRPANTDTWSELSVSDTFLLLDGLLTCTTYECQVRTECIGTASDWSGIHQEQTACPPPCLEAPQALDTMDVGPHQASIHWSGLPEATGYSVHYQVSPAGGWDSVAVGDTMLLLTGLPDCADIRVTVRAYCQPGLQSPDADTLHFSTDCIIGTESVGRHPGSVWATPAPFSGRLDLHCRNLLGDKVSFALLDMTGHLLWSSHLEVSSSYQRVPLPESLLSQLPAGVYVVRVTTADGVHQAKVMKAVSTEN
jgi:hypothetical protein